MASHLCPDQQDVREDEETYPHAFSAEFFCKTVHRSVFVMNVNDFASPSRRWFVFLCCGCVTSYYRLTFSAAKTSVYPTLCEHTFTSSDPPLRAKSGSVAHQDAPVFRIFCYFGVCLVSCIIVHILQ